MTEVARVAAAHGASRVTRVRIAVGPLSGVEAPLLERAFAIARAGTVAEAALLEAEATDVRVWCEACGTESAAAPNRLLCARCGGWRVEVRGGAELFLKSVDLED